MQSSWSQYKGIYVVLGLSLAIAGCASIISGTSQEVQITSTPSSADITIERLVGTSMETAYQGTTPANANLKRKHSYVLTLNLDGYQPVEMGLDNGTNGWIWGNLLFGGFIGLIVDFSNGAAKKLKPDEIHIDLISMSTASLRSSEQLYAVFLIKNADSSVSTTSVPLIPDPEE